MKRRGSLKTLSILNRELANNSYLGGEIYTIADILVFAYVHRADEAGIPLFDFPHIQRWVEDIRLQPGFSGEVHPYSIDPHSGLELPW